MRCTGACCQKIYLYGTYGWPIYPEWLRVWKDRDQDPWAARVWLLFRPSGADEFQMECRALTSTGCVLQREDRPELCNQFPTEYCNNCGARSDQEARGVALQNNT